MSRGTRTTVESGIYADQYGLAARVKVGTLCREKRFPPDRSEEALNAIRQWRARTLGNLLEDHAQQTRQRADARSLTRSIAAYLKRRRGRPGYNADRSHLKTWITALGPKRRHQVTRDDCERAIASWRRKKKPPSEATIRHRVRVLRELYQSLDGKAVVHPLIGIELPKPKRPPLIPVPHDIIQRVASSLAEGKRHDEGYGADPVKTRARFLVYASTGQRPAQIGRAQPSDVDFGRRLWFVRPAKGGDPIPLPLNDGMVDAWRVFAAAKAWGPFDTTSFAKVLRRHSWPKDIRPYALRRTFAIDLLLGGADLGDVQGLLGHSDINTTRKYYAPILTSRMTSAVAGRTLKLDTAVVPPAGVPPRPRSPRQNAPQSSTSHHRRRTNKKGVSKRKRP